MAMDVDGEEDGTQRAATVANFGVVVNFEDLDSDEEEVSLRSKLSLEIQLTTIDYIGWFGCYGYHVSFSYY